MNFGVAFFGVCGIAAVGVLEELEGMQLSPAALFLNDNSILPCYLHACGTAHGAIIKICQKARVLPFKRSLRDITASLRHMRPLKKLYYSTEACDYTTEPTQFTNVIKLKQAHEGIEAMLEAYRKPNVESEMPPQTWPLTNMGCERILLVSPYCCRADHKCSLHIRLPAYDSQSMEELSVSYYQGYRAAEHEKARIYEKLLF